LNLNNEMQIQAEEKNKQLCAFVGEQFEKRRKERVQFELQWQLNMNFLLGNQYCDILPDTNEIIDQDKNFFWQERETYNHIAPIIESRLAKLYKVRPQMLVRPATGDECDIESARVSTSILRSAYSRLRMTEVLNEGTVWAEVCGSVFYKQSWNAKAGKIIGVEENNNQVCEGDLEITVCPPYEIYPDTAYTNSINKCQSVIHARVYSCERIEEIWGKKVNPEEVEVFSIQSNATVAGGLGYASCVPKINSDSAKNSALILEYYEMSSAAYPNGRLIICTGSNLIYEGELPYLNGESEKRVLPFAGQVSLSRPGCLWGISVIERCIPIQRAYNAVKNRKHEFLNRAAIGILAVEEGAVDTENLEEEGLSPGKVLIYRQGANPPQMLATGSLPNEFMQEEASLLQEFVLISGVSDMMRQSAAASNLTSGVALGIIIEQDDARLAITAERIREATLEISRQWLRLFRQFAGNMRLERIVGENGSVSRLYWSANQLTSDDIVHETENELSQSVSQRRQMVYDLLARGIFTDAQGNMDERTKSRLLRSLGLGDWENVSDISDLQIQRAQRENLALLSGHDITVEAFDDHTLHIAEHSKYMLSEDFEREKLINKPLARAFNRHLQEHKQLENTLINKE